MPSSLNGTALNMGLPSPVGITGSTNTNPIVIHTTTPHGLMDGDGVWIYDHEVNTSANGEFFATVVDPTHFSIDTAGVGVGVATGAVQSLAYSPSSFAIPSDATDNVDAASVDVPFEALADRSALANVFLKPLMPNIGVVRAGVMLDITNKDLGVQHGTASMNNTEVIVSASSGSLGRVNQNQIVLVLFSCNLAGTGTAEVGLAWRAVAPGAAPGAYTILGSSYQGVDSTVFGYTLTGLIPAFPLSGGTLEVALVAFSPGIGTAAFYGSYSLNGFVIGG